jgi:hypothetical protein
MSDIATGGLLKPRNGVMLGKRRHDCFIPPNTPRSIALLNAVIKAVKSEKHGG